VREGAETGLWSRTLVHLNIPCPRFIGRERELLWLQERLEQARRGHGNLVLLAGEAGIGKSRLTNEVTARALRANVLVLEGRCSPFESALPYAPFIEAFRGLFHTRTPDQIRALLGSRAPEVARLIPELAEMISGITPSPLLSPPEEKSRLFESLYLVLRQIAAEAPLILTLEDIHWADPASLEFFRFLARRLRRDRWFVLATYRPEEISGAEGPGRLRQDLVRERLAQELTVKPLNAAETGEMLQGVLGADVPAPENLVAWIFQFGEGNPFFTEEILRSIVEGSDDARAPDPATLSGVTVPPTVRETILERVGRLMPDGREVLSAAAVLGRVFELDALQHVSQLAGEGFSRAFMTLLSAQFVRADRTPPRYSFRHALIRETVLQYLAPDTRRALHRRAGEFLEAHASPLVTAQTLAHHFREAGDHEQTIRYALAAASQASSVYAHHEAARFFGLVLEALPPGATTTRLAAAEGLGDALFRSEALDRAVDAFAAMLEYAKAVGMRHEMARAYRKLGQVEEAQVKGRGFESWDRGLAILAKIDDPVEEAMIHQLAARARYRIGQYGRAMIDARAAVAAATRSGDLRALSQAQLSLALVLTMVGRHDEVAAYMRQALALAQQAGDREAEIRALNNGGMAAMEDADFVRSRDALEQGYALARAYGAPRQSWVLDASLSQLSFVDGRWDEAEARARQAATEILEHSELHWPFATAATAFATVLVHRGRSDEADALLQKVYRSPDPGYQVILARNALATLELRRGNAAASKTLLEEAWGIIRATGYGGSGKTETLLLLAEVSLQLNDVAMARSWLDEAAGAVNGYRRLAPAIHRVRGEVAAHEGNLDAAIGHYQAGLDDPATTPQPYQEALLLYHLGACLLRRSRPGDRRAARAHLTQAQAILDRLGAKPVAEMVRQALQRIGGRGPRGRALTEREREVLSLLAQGLSNAAIASRLSISERTVEVHVSHILTKLNLETRTQAASWAVQQQTIRTTH
jgi:predicted ATPase/DNA-binding CsgD family transcriptional regulator